MLKLFYRAHSSEENIFTRMTETERGTFAGVYAVPEDKGWLLNIEEGYFSTRNGDVEDAVVSHIVAIPVLEVREDEWIVRPIHIVKTFSPEEWEIERPDYQ